IFVHDDRRVGELKNLERKGQERNAWYAGQVALALRILSRPLFKVLLLFRQRRRQVRNSTTLHDTEPAWHSQTRGMVLEVPRGRVEGLPYARHVGLTIERSWLRVGLSGRRWSLTRDRSQSDTKESRDGRCRRRRTLEPIRHLRLSSSRPTVFRTVMGSFVAVFTMQSRRHENTKKKTVLVFFGPSRRRGVSSRFSTAARCCRLWRRCRRNTTPASRHQETS